MVGAAMLIVIFLISVDLQEGITKAKWPLYHEYIKQVPRLFPYGVGMRFQDLE